MDHELPDFGRLQEQDVSRTQGQVANPFVRQPHPTGQPSPSAIPDSNPRRPPPPRPLRPNPLPAFPDQGLRNQTAPQSIQPKYWEGSSLRSPELDPPPSGSARTSSAYTDSSRSSTGSIPDFPVPSIPSNFSMSSLPARRAANLGPPPSARKGGPAMYSASSFVPPIPEEVSETHSSYASSHVIPTSWGDGPPEYYMGEGIDEEDESEGGASERQSKVEDGDSSTGLVRQVSLGKVGKPKLRSVKSGEGLEDKSFDFGSQRDQAPSLPGIFRNSPPRPGTAGSKKPLIDTEKANAYSSSAVGDALPTPSLMAPSSAPSSGNVTPVAPLDPRIHQILGSLEKGGAIGTGSTTSPDAPSPEPAAQTKNARRPPRLNLTATRDSEIRGSSSSLPELIRRATKLASNLDRGKTASRLGLLNILEAKEKERSPKGSREGSIADMLAAFPSPSLATPTGERSGSRWPSPLPKSGLARGQSVPGSPSFDEKYRPRRFCGMPLWAFVLLCIIIILLVAAAVIIPVTLVVLPRQHNNNKTDADLDACKQSSQCYHGGTNVFVNKQCRCICSGGYLGAACQTVADKECTNTEITTPDQPTMTFKDATMASGVPRLLQGAHTNFNVPLSAQSLLSLFAYQNLSCAAENALITFDGEASRRRSLHIPFSKRSLPLPEIPLLDILKPLSDALLPTPTSATTSALPTNHERIQLAIRDVSQSDSVDTATSALVAGPTGAALTINGIVFAAPSGAAPPVASPTLDDATASASSTPSASSSSSSSSSDSSSPTSNNQKVTPQMIDFARIATLFIFQETSSLDTAVSTQEKLQAALAGGSRQGGANVVVVDLSHTDVGNGRSVDFVTFTIDLGNGTVFGGGPGGSYSR